MLFFLKLGGSLITNKNKPHTSRNQIIHQIANELLMALEKSPDLKLLIGHGSGSFGHVPANLYKTRAGVSTSEEWQGFLEVRNEASALNKIIIDIFRKEGLPTIAFHPSSMVIAKNRKILKWEISPIEEAIKSNLIPVIYGDVIFDLSLGGTILSTEELFFHLSPLLQPKRILLAGIEEGVWEDFPERRKMIHAINTTNFVNFSQTLGGSSYIDVTGGMHSKVETMLSLIKKLPFVDVMIFSGKKPMNIFNALTGKTLGTMIKNS